MAHVTISLEQIACTDQHELIGLVWSDYSDRRSHVLHRRSDHFLYRKFRWSMYFVLELFGHVQEFRRSEVRSKCTDRGSLGDRQASVQFDRRNLGDRRPHISAQVAVFLTAKMAWRTPKLPDRTDRRPLSYSIGVPTTRSEYFQLLLKVSDLFFFLTSPPKFSFRTTRSEASRLPLRSNYSIGSSRSQLVFRIVSHVQSLRSLPALRRLAENQLSDSPSAYRKPLGFLSS